MLVTGDSSTGGESRLRQSWWIVHTPELGLSESRRKSDWWRVASTVVMVGWVVGIDHMAKP